MVLSIFLTLGLILGVYLCQEWGYRLGLRDSAAVPEFSKGVGAVEAAVFGLVALLMAFVFSSAAGRLENRRELIVQEANAISTAYLRLDLLAPADRDELRALVKQRTDARLKAYTVLTDAEALQQTLAECTALEDKIWTKAVAAGASPQAAPQATMLLMPALNEMFDIATSRIAAARAHVPTLIVVFLSLLIMLSGLLAGYGMAQRGRQSRVHQIVLAVLLGTTVYVVMDLEFPRFGLIRVDGADQAIRDVRAAMK